MQRTEIHKFGGTSVAGAERLAGVARLIHDATSDARVVVVSSAMAGITDSLIRAADCATRGERDEALAVVDEILARHVDALSELGPPDAAAVRHELETVAEQLAELVRASVLLGELTLRSRDRLLSCGEKLAVRLLAAAIRARGQNAQAMDADTFLETDDRFGEANPLAGVADRAVRTALCRVLDGGGVAVVTGFCGRAPDGATTTLGRGGSDLSATFIGATLDADEVIIWTDVSGVYTADPRVVPDARVIPHLNYREAAEMSYYGAKVLHQRSMIPLVDRGLPVCIRNSLAPDGPSTLVDGRYTPGSHPVKAISAVRGQSLLSVEGKGMAGVPGIAGRLFRTLAEHGVSVTMISQSSSESSICLAVPDADARVAERALKDEFRPDLSRGDVEEIGVLSDTGLVAAVGLGMAHVPGIAARVFAALARRRINVLAIAQGSSELNISLAVDGREVDRTVAAIHEEFGLHRLDTGDESESGFDLILIGMGKIGRDLAGLVARRDRHVFERFGLRPRIVAAADRSGFLFRPAGLSPDELRAATEAKADGRALTTIDGATRASSPVEMVRAALEYRLAQPVLVDVSDSDDSAEAFLEAFRRGCDGVTANKKPLAGPLATFEELFDRATESDRLLKAEATVGAGLPVVDTLEMLIATGDRLTLAEGCLSGTLAFIMTRLEEGVPFSRAVEQAVELGYTEPDPVADLSGTDVARKAVILGRMSGLVRCDDPPELEGLVDPNLSGTDVETLLARLAEEYDGPLAERVAAARKKGRALRYVARVSEGAIQVGPREVPADSALGMLRGTDNMIIFESERYHDRPLVVTGPGAGVEVTAMGVLGDILRVAAERRRRD